MDRTEQTLNELPKAGDGGRGFPGVERRWTTRIAGVWTPYIAPGGEKQDTLEGWSYDAASDVWTSPEGAPYIFSGVREKPRPDVSCLPQPQDTQAEVGG